MVLNVKTGRAALARPTTDRDRNMAKQNPKVAERTKQLPRIRVCGRWQKPNYVASKEEQAAWEQRCKDRNWDPKTGKPKIDKTAPGYYDRGKVAKK